MAKIEKLLEQARAHLGPDESVLCAVMGTYEGSLGNSKVSRSGVLIATSQRLVFFGKKLTGYDLESFPYDKVSSLEQGKNMMGASIKFFASGNEVQLKWIAANQPLDQLVKIVHDHAGRGTAAAAAATMPSAPAGLLEQVEQLARLHAAGVLTEAEFSAKKAELLARL